MGTGPVRSDGERLGFGELLIRATLLEPAGEGGALDDALDDDEEGGDDGEARQRGGAGGEHHMVVMVVAL